MEIEKELLPAPACGTPNKRLNLSRGDSSEAAYATYSSLSAPVRLVSSGRTSGLSGVRCVKQSFLLWNAVICTSPDQEGFFISFSFFCMVNISSLNRAASMKSRSRAAFSISFLIFEMAFSI